MRHSDKIDIASSKLSMSSLYSDDSDDSENADSDSKHRTGRARIFDVLLAGSAAITWRAI